MSERFELNVNGATHTVDVDAETPLLYVLRNDLGLSGPKFGCGGEQCNACKVLIDGADVPSCELPVHQAAGLEIVTVEGLGTPDAPHPLQETFMEEQALQCGYCAAGMVIAAQGLLNRVRYPTDDDIRTALTHNLCRCGVYERVRRAIKMRIGQPIWDPIYDVQVAEDLGNAATPQSRSLDTAPDLDAWLRINEDKTITLFTGKVEIGQGILTAVAQIAAEELDVDVARIDVVSADTARTPDEGLTSGSLSVEVSGGAIRVASAEARQVMLDMAFEELEARTPAAQLEVRDGTIRDPATGRETTYWALMGGRRFGRQISGSAPLKSPADYTTVGQPEKRADVLRKVTGVPSYVHDLRLPGMVHGRIVRPPAYRATLVSADFDGVARLPGVIRVVRDGSFLGVVAEREEQAIAAMEALAASADWSAAATLPAPGELYADLRRRRSQPFVIERGVPTPVDAPPPVATPADAAQTLRATFRRPYQMHGSLGPSAAVAQWVGETVTIWTHSQGIFRLRGALAPVLGVPEDAIHLIHREGAGCYGHNGADDVALDAALMARAVPGRPVSVKWMREQEHAWEPYGPAMELEMQASLDADGTIVAWNHDVWSYSHLGRPMARDGSSGLIAAWHLAEPWAPAPQNPVLRAEIGSHRNASPIYAFAHERVVKHFVFDSPLRTSAMRALGAYGNVFAIESFMDELALAAGQDPVAFRLNHLDDPRARAVLEAAATKLGWDDRSRPARDGHGRGVALARYKNKQCWAAVGVEVDVDRDSGDIRVRRVVIAGDAGQIVNPDGVSNQLEGGVLQALSWTLLEQVGFDATHVNTVDWETYPILRFEDAPTMEVVLLDRPSQPFLGVGEATQGPTPAALANAIFDATGVRLREIPFRSAENRARLRRDG